MYGSKLTVVSENADVENRVRIVAANMSTRVGCIEHLP
jgi:hypothetical protein